MSDQIYRFRSIYNGSGKSYFADDGSSSYGVSNPHSFSDPAMYSVHDRFRIPASNFGEGIRTSAADPAAVSGLKRSAEALYHQTLLGSHSIGQTEALFSTNSLVKLPRFEIANNLPIYPQRPGEKDCAHYMMTRTCKFGDACKFDHPIWVPEGGNPDWKEIPFVPAGGLLPERPGEPDCPYYLKTQSCKYGFKCKFNHSVDKLNESGTECAANSVYPERPSEPICSFYAKTGQCKFGPTCKFHHPKDVQIQPRIKTESGQENTDTVGGDSKPTKMFVPVTPALLHNSKGLPIRLGETDCPFYLKTGSCKYGAMCRYNHPERTLTVLGHSSMPSVAVNLPINVSNAPANFLSNINQQLVQTSLGATPTVYPQRPGQAECDFYMKNGQCSFGEKCKFHHPIDRSAPTSVGNQTLQQHVKLTLAGLPRREGVASCPFYMKTGMCKYGATCRFDHPPPGEAVAMAAHGSGAATVANTAGEEDNGVCPEELHGSAP